MATTQVETVSTGADKAKLAAVVALVIGSVAGFYLLNKQGPYVQWGVLLLGLALAAAVFVISDPGQRLLALGAMHGVKSRRSSGLHARRPCR